MNYKLSLQVAGIVFLFVAALHLVRCLMQWSFIIGGYTVPMWLSGIGFGVALCLSFWMFLSTR